MGLRLGLLLAAASASCSSKTKGAEDARRHVETPAVHDAAVVVPTSGQGDVQIRVEWKDVPVAARTSPGRTPCGTARAPSVAPTTTWGIPDAFVAIDAPGTVDRPAPRIVLDACALVPHMSLAQTHATIASNADTPAKLTLHRIARLPTGSAAIKDAPKTVYLPVAGHSVDVVLEPRTIYQVETADDDAWIFATDQAFVGITEASGQVVLRDVPAGAHAIHVWVPQRAGQEPHVADEMVVVTPGGLAEVTVHITE